MTKEYKFKDFVEAIDFVNDVAKVAEAQDHHPDILVKYNQVALTYWTHTENRVTEKDQRLAVDVDNIFKKRSSKN